MSSAAANTDSDRCRGYEAGGDSELEVRNAAIAGFVVLQSVVSRVGSIAGREESVFQMCECDIHNGTTTSVQRGGRV